MIVSIYIKVATTGGKLKNGIGQARLVLHCFLGFVSLLCCNTNSQYIPTNGSSNFLDSDGEEVVVFKFSPVMPMCAPTLLASISGW